MAQKIGKQIIRETAAISHDGTPLMIELHPGFVKIWPKHKRFSYTIPWLTVFEVGGKLTANERFEIAKKQRQREQIA